MSNRSPLRLGVLWGALGVSVSLGAPLVPARAQDAPQITMAPAAGATFTRQGEDFVVTTPVYSATIEAKTGLLQNLTIGGVSAVTKTGIDLNKLPFSKISVVQEAPDKVTSYFTADNKGVAVDKALRVSYEATANTLKIRVLATQGRVAGNGMRFDIGPEAQMVRSLDFKETVPLPVLRGRSPWLKVKYFFSNGATLGITNQGSGNPFNANENGGVSGFQYARRGFVANSEYTYTLNIEAGDGKKVLGSPAMTVAEAKTPAVFWQGEPVVANLSLAKADTEKLNGLSGLKLKFTVQDAWENEVAQGEVPFVLAGDAPTTEIKVPLKVDKLGWYRAYFTVNDAKNSLLESSERLIFSVMKKMPNMGERFDSQIQTNYTIGLGFTRIGVARNIKSMPKTVDQKVTEAQGTDVIVSYQIDDSPVGKDPQKFGQFMFDLFTEVGDKIPRIEIINEPNGRYTPREYIETFLRPAYENIKKASPNTKVVGPVLVGLSTDAARYLDELYKLGLKDVTDELSFHPYGGNFDDGGAIASMQKLQAVIAAHGDSAKPIFFTEAGYSHGGWSDVSGMREIIKYLISQYAWQDAMMGIDYRHNLYYFTDQMGYYDFWLRSTQLTPAAVAMRAYTGFVKGQNRAQQLSFGSRENVRAFLYPGDQKQVVALWTASNRDSKSTSPATFTTDAKTVEWYDCFGNPLPAKVANGRLTLDVPTFPTYLVLPAKSKITPVAEKWGTNMALTTLGAIAEATTEQGTYPAISAIDGNTASQSTWRSLMPNQLPQTLTVSLAGPTSIGSLGLWSYNARGYDIEALGANGQWEKKVSRRDQPYQRFRLETFKPFTAEQVRVTVVDSYSDFADIAELQVFSPVGTAQSEVVNWAAATEGATARASSELKKEITVAEQDYGAKVPRINQMTLDAKAANAIDGKRIISGWREFFPTTWMAEPNQPLPQWLEISFPGPKKLTSVAVYTIAFATWSPADSGVRDWDVQVWENGDWKTVDSVRGNQKVSVVSRFKTPVTTDKIRILVTGTNDPEGTVGLMEVQAFGPR